jgi:hypothetical protein
VQDIFKENTHTVPPGVSRSLIGTVLTGPYGACYLAEKKGNISVLEALFFFNHIFQKKKCDEKRRKKNVMPQKM